MNHEAAPPAALEMLPALIAANANAAARGPARRIASSRHYAVLRYWFMLCRDRGCLLSPALVEKASAHVDRIRRSRTINGSLVDGWWETTLLLVTPDESGRPPHTTVFAERWVAARTGPAKDMAFYSLREVDRELAAATLVSHWQELSRNEQGGLLYSVKSLKQEAFLSEIADGKDKESRGVATRILCSLRGSALAEELWAELSGCFEITNGTFSVKPPSRHTPLMDALGARKDRAYPEMTANETYLLVCLSVLPNSYWTTKFGLPASALVPLLMKSDRARAYAGSMVRAAKGCRDVEWTRAFLEHPETVYQISPGVAVEDVRRDHYPDLVAVLPPAEREPYLERVTTTWPWSGTFDDAPTHIWSASTADSALCSAQRMGQLKLIDAPEEAFFRMSLMETLAWHLPSADAAFESLDLTIDSGRIAAEELAKAVQQRDEILAAFGMA